MKIVVKMKQEIYLEVWYLSRSVIEENIGNKATQLHSPILGRQISYKDKGRYTDEESDQKGSRYTQIHCQDEANLERKLENGYLPHFRSENSVLFSVLEYLKIDCYNF